MKPTLQVPRMPSVSQPGSARAVVSLRNATSTWSEGRAVGARRAVVTIASASRAVGDDRRVSRSETRAP